VNHAYGVGVNSAQKIERELPAERTKSEMEPNTAPPKKMTSGRARIDEERNGERRHKPTLADELETRHGKTERWARLKTKQH
jgi:hypothetical protein